MSYLHFYKNLEAKAKALCPDLSQHVSVDWQYLISPYEIQLPHGVWGKAEKAIAALFRLSHNPSYRAALEPAPSLVNQAPPNWSLLMAYDFHTDEFGRCALVEINTNASGFMLASLMEMAHHDTEWSQYEPLQKLRQSFAQELKFFGREANGAQVAIADDEIESQKMFVEFLLYRQWLNSQGFSAEFCDAADFKFDGRSLTNSNGQRVDLVYNRCTDFYLEQPEHLALAQAFAAQAACLSPHPMEYHWLANKQRLVQLGQSEFLSRVGASAEDVAAIQEVIIPTYEKSQFASIDELWAERKNLFFKPKQSYGGKSVYRGESVSRKVFERLMSEDILIQRYVPAQRVPVDDPRSVLSHWKFDLRLYVYGDQIQLAAARIYQGQVTNFASPMGGFTLVRP